MNPPYAFVKWHAAKQVSVFYQWSFRYSGNTVWRITIFRRSYPSLFVFKVRLFSMTEPAKLNNNRELSFTFSSVIALNEHSLELLGINITPQTFQKTPTTDPRPPHPTPTTSHSPNAQSRINKTLAFLLGHFARLG